MGSDAVEKSFQDFKADFEKNEKEKAKELEEKKTAASAATSISNRPKPSSQPPKVSDDDDDDDDDDDEETAGIVRGYKKTSDGRTTSYFHQEMDDAAKQLLKDTAPKPLTAAGDCSPLPPPAASSDAVSASSWNKAGTWEEREMTASATVRLKDMCQQATCTSTVNDPTGLVLVATIAKANKCEGEAQIILARGKKRHVYDFTLSLDFEITVDSPAPAPPPASGSGSESTNQDGKISKRFKGSIELSDVTGSGEPFQHCVKFSKAPSAALSRSVQAAAEQLVGEVRRRVAAFDAEFKAL
jgi:hypothetical protein